MWRDKPLDFVATDISLLVEQVNFFRIRQRAELETLRQEVEKQKILVEAYELMLELARERLHVDVKKNYEEMLLAGLLRDRKNGEVKP